MCPSVRFVECAHRRRIPAKSSNCRHYSFAREIDMSRVPSAVPKILVGLIAMTVASAALAQANRASLDVGTSTGVPEFRDPKTGQVWTPETVGQDGRPLAGPEDKAFDPRAQNVPAMIAEQRVRGRPVGSVPITAGPTVPIVAMDSPTLRAVPGQRWQVVMYLDNNSNQTVEPVIQCRFLNGGNTVMDTRAKVTPTGPGIRQGLLIYGPRVDAFVDRASCNVISP
jgi:hypothetical protein